MLKATFDEENNCWRLNGVKRFITNGDAHLHLVLARSEEGTTDGRGLSMFIYDKRDGGVNVRRIENKLGIHGSPTCELVYKNAKAELVGDRKMGLIKYVMALMNGARLGIAAQSVGISQAATANSLAKPSSTFPPWPTCWPPSRPSSMPVAPCSTSAHATSISTRRWTTSAASAN